MVRPRQRAVGLAVSLALVLAMVAAIHLPIDGWITAAGGRLLQHGPAGVAAYCVLFVLCAVALVPTFPLSFAAGLLYGPWGLVLAWFCIMLASALSLPIMRHLLGELVDTVLSGRPRLRLVSEVISDEGWRAVLLLRLSGGAPLGLQNCILAATKIRYLPYLLATAVGVLPGVALSAGSGAFGRAAVEMGDVGRAGFLAVGVLAAITLVSVSAAKVRARLALTHVAARSARTL